MIVIAPLHSVTSPTVGVAYLKSYLESSGIDCPCVDLNIHLYQKMRGQLQASWLHWIFPFGERTYGAELLMSQACFGRSVEDVLTRLRTAKTESLRLFLESLDIERHLTDAPAQAVVSQIAQFLHEAVRWLAQAASTWIGFSVVITNIPATIFLIRELKRLRPEVRIVLGGPNFHKENARTWLDALSEIDAVVIGDARNALPDWIAQRATSDAQVVTRADNSSKLQNQSIHPQADYEYADWSDFPLAQYEPSLVIDEPLSGPVLPLYGSIGCSYNKCTFCYEVLLTPRFRTRPIDQVVDELIHQNARHGSTGFFFTNLDFNSDYETTRQLCQEITRRGPQVRFACWLRAHELDDVMLESLYEAGCRQYSVGLESVVTHLLDLMKKGYDRAHALAVVKRLNAFALRHPDIKYAFNLITHYPGETLEDVRETLGTVREHPQLFRQHVAALFEFCLTTNTLVWNKREQLGIRPVESFLEFLLPEPLAQELPAHRYWYEYQSDDYATRTLLWDVLRQGLGHSPRYLRLS